MCAALQLPAKVVAGFVDVKVNRLLGLQHAEGGRVLDGGRGPHARRASASAGRDAGRRHPGTVPASRRRVHDPAMREMHRPPRSAPRRKSGHGEGRPRRNLCLLRKGTLPGWSLLATVRSHPTTSSRSSYGAVLPGDSRANRSHWSNSRPCSIAQPAVCPRTSSTLLGRS